MTERSTVGLINAENAIISPKLMHGGMSVRTALVYDGELSPGVREDGYFDFLVPVEALFE